METITLTSRDQIRLQLVTQVERGEVTVGEAAASLGCSTRQMRRILAGYRAVGVASLIHGNRGRPPRHTVAETVRQQVIGLLATTYAGINDSQLSELLAEREGIVLSRSTVRRLRVAAGRPAVRPRRSPRHRQRRERKAAAGMLVQIDGSRHRWLGPGGPWLTLIAGIDDATGVIVGAVFREQEDGAGYLTLLHQVVTTVGRPQAVYHDRHGIFLRSAHEPETVAEQLAGARQPTQVGRAFQAFGIASIAARSPQAKGRVERLFGTLQDRLVVELRLAGVTTLAAANQALPAVVARFNAQFAVPAADPTPVWRPLDATMDPWQVCCFAYTRIVGHDDTIRVGEQRVQLAPRPHRRTWARATVTVRDHLDGSRSVWHGGECITTTPAPLDAGQLRAQAGLRAAANPTPVPPRPPAPTAPDEDRPRPVRPPRKPASDHPWRRSAHRG